MLCVFVSFNYKYVRNIIRNIYQLFSYENYLVFKYFVEFFINKIGKRIINIGLNTM